MSAAGPRCVAVVGGGWAGCAAAVTLARAGLPVTLFEQAKTLGGRARRVVLDGVAVDNGQHLMIGAYVQVLALLSAVHGATEARRLFHRLPLTMRPFGAPRRGTVSIAAWRAPAPLHLAGGMLGADGLAWRERLALVSEFRRLARAGFRCPPAQTVAQCFAGGPLRAFAAVWEPLCLAALNTPPEAASAQMFANVLRAAFTGSRRHSDFLVPAVDLSALFPDAAARLVSAHGGEVRTATLARVFAPRDGVTKIRTATGDESFAAAIVAVAPHQLAGAFVEPEGDAAPWYEALVQTMAFRYESITTVYLGLAAPVELPARLARLDDAPGQWVFDRSDALPPDAPGDARSLVSVVISAGGAHDLQDHAALAADIEAQLRRLDRRLPAVVWSRVIAERRATYACAPALRRPVAGRIVPGLYLAGDYTDPDFPATLEAATRSGVAAARAAISDDPR
ncbi:MAG: hydroxysqualene dehydroxylase HpnE [Betaproteobacteria bacterium]